MSDIAKNRMGFYDSKNKIFYEIETIEEYQQCLDYYHKKIKEQNSVNTFDMLNDFDSLV